ncbi:Bifunctional NAD(P)H-hydrate repair enzyme Nnr [anaerobic digester metagenome]
MTPKNMMVIDANAEAMGIPKLSLMENAGRCLAEVISKISEPCKTVIFAGNGGNGGDGFVAARYLLNKGFEVNVILLSHPSRIKSQEARANLEVLQKITRGLRPLKIQVIEDSSNLKKLDSGVMVDAILGTGVRGKLREPVSTAVDVINASNGIKIAVDVPTGLDPLTGEVHHKSVVPDITVTFHRAKKGLKNASIEHVGNVHVCDIGIPPEVEIFTGPGDMLRIQKRSENSHKGQNGRVLIIGGSADYSGAPALAASASMRSGVDIAVLASPKAVSDVIRSYSPDVIVRTLSNTPVTDFVTPENVDEILKLSENADSMVIGCGIGRADETGDALNELVQKVQNPVVIDADALKLIDIDTILKSVQNGTEVVLTPHKAEFKSFFGSDVPQSLEDRMNMVLGVSKNSGAVVVLKGAVDVISNGNKVRLNATGNPGMTVGGTGDVLAGLIGGLMAQGHDAFESAYLGAYINGRAGDLAQEGYGFSFTASQVADLIPEVLNQKK